MFGLETLLVLALALFQLGPTELLEDLPAPLREQARAFLQEPDASRRAALAEQLSRNDSQPAIAFLLSVLEQEDSATVRLAIVNRLGRNPAPQVQRMLAERAAGDPDADVSLRALERLRGLRLQELRPLLQDRIERARRAGDAAGLRALAGEHERWVSLARGAMLPAFLRVPPAPFVLKPRDARVRVLAFGDFGDGGANQRRVAEAMLRAHRQRGFDFGLTLGDNFYDVGLRSPDDPRWQTWWEDMYRPLGLRIWATLGNHDWGDPDSPAAQILRTQKSSSWRLPAPYYTFSAGPAQFFALDTNDVSEAQLLWLRDALLASAARWKVVYGHHPIYSAGVHQDNEVLKSRLLPVLRNRADIYLAGHDHDLQHLAPDGGVHFFVSGCGGKSLREPTPMANSLFAAAAYAFTVLEVENRRLRIVYLDTGLRELYRYTLEAPNVIPLGGSEDGSRRRAGAR